MWLRYRTTAERNKKIQNLVGCFLLYNWVGLTGGTPCGHRPPPDVEVTLGVLLESSPHATQRRSFGQPFRIYLSYDSSITQLPSATQTILKDQILEPAVSYWSSTLSVAPSSSPIKLLQSCVDDVLTYLSSDPQPYCANGCSSSTTCGEVPVPASHLAACRNYHQRPVNTANDGPGVANADFVLYVSSVDTQRCQSSAVAYAAYCQLELQLDRPVAGYVNICPKEFAADLASQVGMLASVVKHEILHAIGFSYGLFAFYRDADGQPLTPRTQVGNRPPATPEGMYISSDRVVKVIQRPNWLMKNGAGAWSVTMLVTPRVQAEVRLHFNCSSLEGAELENQGDSGTQLTHWEKRVFENELMTGIYTQLPVVSRITLALLEDTGWYRANYDNAEALEWGENLGCDFVQNSCLSWMLSRQARGESVHPFCSRLPSMTMSGAQAATSTQTECDVNRHAKTLCNLQVYSQALEQKYQYFSNASLGGYVELADFCPYVQVFNYKQNSVAIRDSRCLFPANQPAESSNFGAETYTTSARCFEQQKPFVASRCGSTSVATALTYGSGCYEFKCSSDRGLAIIVLGTEYRCYFAGQNVSVAVVSASGYVHMGVVVCPSCSSLCQEQGVTCPPDQFQAISSAARSIRDVCASVNSAVAVGIHYTIALGVVVAAILQCTWLGHEV